MTLCVPLTLTNFYLMGSTLYWTATIGTSAFAFLLCAYFAFILFRRLQCSLLEFIALIAFLGNIEGLILTTPSILSPGTGLWPLAPLAAGWVFYGTVVTLVEARLLGLEHPLPRLLLLVANCYVLAVPALFLVGLLLLLTGTVRGLATGSMPWKGVALLLAGLVGCFLFRWLSHRTPSR